MVAAIALGNISSQKYQSTLAIAALNCGGLPLLSASPAITSPPQNITALVILFGDRSR